PAMPLWRAGSPAAFELHVCFRGTQPLRASRAKIGKGGSAMASGSHYDRYRSSGADYVRHTLNALHQHGTGVGAKVWAFLLAFPGIVQGVYYVLTGLWPQLSIRSFLEVTGPKTDHWLVHTVGWLVFVIGVAMCLAAYRRQKTVEVLIVSIGSAVALAVVEVYYVLEHQISAVYLLDAAIQLGVLFLWIASVYTDLGETNTAAGAQQAVAVPKQAPATPHPPVPQSPAAAVPPAPRP